MSDSTGPLISLSSLRISESQGLLEGILLRTWHPIFTHYGESQLLKLRRKRNPGTIYLFSCGNGLEMSEGPTGLVCTPWLSWSLTPLSHPQLFSTLLPSFPDLSPWPTHFQPSPQNRRRSSQKLPSALWPMGRGSWLQMSL